MLIYNDSQFSEEFIDTTFFRDGTIRKCRLVSVSPVHCSNHIVFQMYKNTNSTAHATIQMRVKSRVALQDWTWGNRRVGSKEDIKNLSAKLAFMRGRVGTV